MSGRPSYEAGLSAEEAVARHYAATGRRVVERRWRGRGGEIDLIAAEGDRIVFVEVKKADTHRIAAERLTPAQQARIFRAAEEFLGTRPAGTLTEARIDVALLDRFGRIEILRDAFAA